MSRRAYFDYLEEVWEDIEECFNKASSETKRIIFRLTASPYHFWLENQAALAQSSPKESSVQKDSENGSLTHKDSGEVSPPAPAISEDSSNLANKAQEIREKAKIAVRAYAETGEKQWSGKALAALWALRDDWGKGMTVYKALDLIPDKELCLWNDKHEVFM